MLVWLKKLGNIDLQRICANFPDENAHLAYLVRLVFAYYSSYKF